MKEDEIFLQNKNSVSLHTSSQERWEKFLLQGQLSVLTRI